MFQRLVELMGFMPGGHVAAVAAAGAVVVIVAVLVLRVAFSIALRIAYRLVGEVQHARRLAMTITAFTGGGFAIPFTMDGFLGMIQKLW